MPVVPTTLEERAALALEQWGATLSLAERKFQDTVHALVERINIPYNSSSPPGLIQANTEDPWKKSGKYALGWVYFSIILLVLTSAIYLYHSFTDRIRTAMHEEELQKGSYTSSPDYDYELPSLQTGSTQKFFPRNGELPKVPEPDPTIPLVRRPLNVVLALCRMICYHPLPEVEIIPGYVRIVFPPLGVLAIVVAAVAFVTLYTFLPKPLYWQSIAFGSPPVAIRSGMLAISLVPWIIAMAMKANVVSLITGIGHERLNVLHRWAAYLCLFLSLIHTIPFYITPISDNQGLQTWKSFFKNANFYIYGTGLAALVPLLFLILHSLPCLRRWGYELFVMLHVPVSIVWLGMLFWHCHNYLTSWSYLWATVVIWASSYFGRVLFLNWARWWRMSWLIGDEAAITILPENAIKITIPTQVKWRPGQYVYLRMPGISLFGNHPFTIASLCSDDFPSEYGEGYRDMVIVFRPFGGFTRKALEKGLEDGPWETYRAFIDGPYGGMRRRMESFDHVVMIAGGSGITSIVSHLLDLIKRMRDGKAITKNIHVIWAMKRPETMEWFREELRICREFAPPDSVRCQFFITAAKRQEPRMHRMTAQTTQKHISAFFHERINDTFQGVAEKRSSYISKRSSAYIEEEADGDPEREQQLRAENEDTIAPLPQAHLVPTRQPSFRNFSHPVSNTDRNRNLGADLITAVHAGNTGALDPDIAAEIAAATAPRSPIREKGDSPWAQVLRSREQALSAPTSPVRDRDEGTPAFNFGFPSTPTEFQKNLMRFAFLPAAARGSDGWSTEYGRPDLPYMLRTLGRDFGRRTCVFVCGPPSMRIAVANQVARMQTMVLGDGAKEEIFMHTENYAL